MSNPLVSYIIPTHNRAEYIEKAIRSILDQTYKNVEVVVVDDVSRDDTEQIVKSIHDSRVIYIRNPYLLGPNASRNNGLNHIHGEYIGLLDDDDYFTDNKKIEKQMFLFNKNESVVAVSCGYYNETMGTTRHPVYRGDDHVQLLKSYQFIETSTIIMKASLVKKLGGFDTGLPSEQNHDFFYRLSAEGFFDYIDDVCVFKGDPDVKMTNDMRRRIRGHIAFRRKHCNDTVLLLGLAGCLFVFLKMPLVLGLFTVAHVLKKPELTAYVNICVDRVK